MKKTYKTNNGENRSSFFRVGRKLVTVRFLPTFTTENPMVQAAIEKSIAFREGIQLVTSSMQWIKIDRDENGFATEKCLDEMFTSLPIVVIEEYPNRFIFYRAICDLNSLNAWRLKIYHNINYTHYLKIPRYKK
jgi:hypothetical protein